MNPIEQLPEEIRNRIDQMVDGRLSEDDRLKLERELSDDPQLQDAYLEYIEFQSALHHLLQSGEVLTSVDGVLNSLSPSPAPVRRNHNFAWAGWLTAALAIFVSVMVLRSPVPQTGTAPVTNNAPSFGRTGAVLVEAAGAELFGALLPALGDSLDPNREYTLVTGMMKLKFQHGAEAILKAPAVIEIVDVDHLLVKVGTCSVYAPPGAEGFEVTTPQSRIIDLGTRFSVEVTESGETEVQVVEGEAEVDATGTIDPQIPLARLTEGNGFRLKSGPTSGAFSIPFTPEHYSSQLPDRVIRYEMTNDSTTGASILQNVTVQRNGTVLTYDRHTFNDAEIIHFSGGDSNLVNRAILTSQSQLNSPSRFQDYYLNTGFINPGGSKKPLTTSPVIKADSASADTLTPGIAYRFKTPVRNEPGVDFIIFELQSKIDPVGGDSIHLSPLQFRGGLKSITITNYDITLNSPEAKPLLPFHNCKFKSRSRTLEDLSRDSDVVSPNHQFHAIAIAIDLSSFGYEDGELVEGFFLQDALDDNHYVDPVFIGGLPALDVKKETQE